MKKYLLFILFIFIVLVVILKLNIPVYAQNNTLAKDSQNWKCLTGTSSSYNLTWHDPPSPPTLTQELSGDGYGGYDTVYVVGCAPETSGTICSSGEKDTDNLLFNANNTGKISVTIVGGSKKKPVRNQIKATAVVSGVNTVATGGYSFYGITILPPQNSSLVGGAGAQQQGTFTFEGDNNSSKCVKISWTHYDPYGIVFDSQSLEPIPDVTVLVLDKNKNKLQLLGLTNPQTTKSDGLFNFLVEPGVYYLDVPTLPKGYNFTDNPNLNPNYSLIYHKSDGGNSIYKPGETIPEIIDTPEEQAMGKPNPERRDIPLDPGINTPYKNNPQIIIYGVTRVSDKTEIEGKTSHPFTEISIYQANKLLSTQNADRQGFFYFLLDNKTISPEISLNAVLKKIDLTGDLKKIVQLPRTYDVLSMLETALHAFGTDPIVFADTVSSRSFIRIDPILTSVIGYAKDMANHIIPNAIVDVRLQMANKPYYQTQADKNGYFYIPTKNLPIFNYNIDVAPPYELSSSTTYTTAAFTKSNENYIKTNHINLMAYSSSENQLITNKINIASQAANKELKFNTQSSNPNTYPTKLPDQKQAQQSQKPQTAQLMLIIIIIISSLLTITAGFLFYYIYIKRNKSI